jgi:GH15 family glucan-1,4-alpha-glucosidase
VAFKDDMTTPRAFVPYPDVGRHGIIGDTCTSALVAADGTIDWMCALRHDGQPLFDALLDAERGGYFRLGPVALVQGDQSYLQDTAVLTTRWTLDEGTLELCDTLCLPARGQGGRDGQDGPAGNLLVRRLRCLGGEVACAIELDLSATDRTATVEPAVSGDDGLGCSLRIWCSDPAALQRRRLRLGAGQTLHVAIEIGPRMQGAITSAAAAERAINEDAQRWRRWVRTLSLPPGGRQQLVRSAITIHVLSYRPAGSVVAAATTSLPERIGGSWNADYRLTWIRDASLSLSLLARLGDLRSARRFVDWIAARGGNDDGPLQVLYAIDGAPAPIERERRDLAGYRGSRPVRFGNHAFRQRQLGSYGFFAGCLLTYLEHGGSWDPSWWQLLRRIADHLSARWHEPDNSIWELTARHQYVASHVMSWAALDRITRIAVRVGRGADVRDLEPVRSAIMAEVEGRGYRSAVGAFVQRYQSDALDAASLLVLLSGMFSPDDPRVRGTIDAVDAQLSIDGFVYRFVPRDVPGLEARPLGEFEGAFLPCTFWMAQALAQTGRRQRAGALLDRVEAIAGPLGLFAEAVDPRSNRFLGNTPLLFSHVTHADARLALEDDPRRPWRAR